MMPCLRGTRFNDDRNPLGRIVIAICICAGAFVSFIGLTNVAGLGFGDVRETKPSFTSLLRNKKLIQSRLIFHELTLEGLSTRKKSWRKRNPSQSSKSKVSKTFKYKHFRVSEQGEEKSNEKSETQASAHITNEDVSVSEQGEKKSKETNAAPTTTEVLQSISSRFYIYDDRTISQSRVVDERRQYGEKAFGESARIDHVKADMKGENLILEALENHPLRTWNPNEAEIFVVPTPITELLAYGCQWEDCTWYDDAFHALSNHPIFKRTQGHRHVIIALSWPSFNKRYSSYFPALSRNYRLIENVTVAHNYDPFGCVKLHEQKQDKGGDFKKVYPGEMPVTNAFSLGLGFNDPFPVHLPTYQKFESSDYFIFYHSRTKTFAYGSTPYRNKPLEKKVIKKLPSSSIGNDVPLNEWSAAFTSSKFCLVIRGDTPHSHALLYSVRAGCIPVVISDDYQDYAGSFKSSLSITDFSVIIKERDFLKNPTKQLLNLQNLSKDFIQTKLENLYIAQTLVIPNHPRSLFVPAFLREVLAAEKNVIAPRAQIEVHEDKAVISGRELTYRYPSTLTRSPPVSDTEELIVIVGVVSESENVDARNSIRGTWAAESKNRVFFLVAGQWGKIAEEFQTYGDLLWLEMKEDDFTNTYKVQVLLHAVNAHVDSYDYVMKTEDDTYTSLDSVKKHLSNFTPDYWGSCKTEDKDRVPSRDITSKNHMDENMWPYDLYPQYAQGMGYVLSREFNTCAVSHLATVRYLRMEDAATGLLAELCGVACREDGWDWGADPTGNELEFIAADVKNSAAMVYKHWYALWQRGGWDP